MSASGVFAARRRAQARDWVHTLVEDYLRSRFYAHQGVRAALPGIEQAVMAGTLPVTAAVRTLVRAFEGDRDG
jgi:LAO/AO transport system kinase